MIKLLRITLWRKGTLRDIQKACHLSSGAEILAKRDEGVIFWKIFIQEPWKWWLFYIQCGGVLGSRYGLELGVGAVALGVPDRLFVEVAGQGRLQVNTGLVGEAQEHKEDIGHFVGQVVALSRLEALVAVAAHEDTGEFPCFFHQDA